MSDNLSAAAKALGIPEPLVKRSAEARAAATGAEVEEILAAWAGGEAPAPSATAEPVEEAGVDEAAVEEEAAEEPSEEAPPEAAEPVAPPAAPPVERPAAAAAVAAPPQAPTEVSEVEAAKVPVVVTVPTSNLKERTTFTMPRWLTAVLIGAPLFALFALGGSATGTCGEGTELRTDVVSGKIVNCDGTEFTGSAIGGGQNFVALGERIYSGGEAAGVNCAGCHAASGQGLAPFPSLTGVLTTFGACTDHVEWVSLGTQGFENAGESTYGDTAKPLRGTGGVMPTFGSSLTPEQIAAVAAFERVRFGGADPETTLVDCGLAEEAAGDGGAGTEGEQTGGEEGSGAGTETDTEGGEEPTTTTAP
jgi:hypothetical protein